jgi:hypothetical protein
VLTKLVPYNWHIVPPFVFCIPERGHLSRTGHMGRGAYMYASLYGIVYVENTELITWRDPKRVHRERRAEQC